MFEGRIFTINPHFMLSDLKPFFIFVFRISLLCGVMFNIISIHHGI